MMMMKQPKDWRLLATAVVVSSALSACGGSDGNSGDDGDPGRPGGEPAMEVNTLNLEVTNVNYTDGQPVVTVLATNEDDESIVGLQSLQVKQYQLYPQGSDEVAIGDSAKWESNGSQSQFVDQGNGYYTFTFADTTPNLNLTQRFNVVAGTSALPDGTAIPAQEISVDFNGDGAAPQYTKNVVSHEVCAQCHLEGELLTFGRHSAYTEVETCIACHSETKLTGKRTSFQHLVHAIHNSETSFVDKKDHLYSGEAAEALIGNDCRTCHVESAELAEWGNWNRVPTKETCTGCHNKGYDDNKFPIPSATHIAQKDNSECATCHTPEQISNIHTLSHEQTDAVIGQWGTDVEMAYNAGSDNVSISVTVLDEAGVALDPNAIVSNIERLELTTNVGPNFPIHGYGYNSFNAVERGELADNVTIVGNTIVAITNVDFGGEGTDADTAFTFAGLSVCSEGDKIISCEGVATDADGHTLDEHFTGMNANLAFTTKSGAEPSKRHTDSVSAKACAECHSDNFEIHKGTHHPGFVMGEQVDFGLDGCVSCHTPAGTYASTNLGAIEQKLHARHGSEAIIQDCAECHSSFNLGAFANKGAINTGVLDGGSPYNPADAAYGTPIAATCGSCHNYDAAIEHMTGGTFGNGKYNAEKSVAQDAVAAENCFICHAPSLENHKALNF